MQIISTKLHGAIDYLMVVVLLGLPYMLHCSTGHIAGHIFIIVGFALLTTNFITRYEHGVINIVPMQVHLLLDKVLGAALAASPWLFGFSVAIYVPHLVSGLVLIALALTTQTKTSLIT